MSLSDAVDILRRHNEWRRGDGKTKDMVEPALVGQAIDIVCDYADALLLRPAA